MQTIAKNAIIKKIENIVRWRINRLYFTTWFLTLSINADPEFDYVFKLKFFITNLTLRVTWPHPTWHSLKAKCWEVFGRKHRNQTVVEVRADWGSEMYS